ncbi:Bet v I type allergen protein [Dioscorea alata]|uniref:Bet v I type allergen protein n=1 Tax=Dioscorea alata TaxID=55571 RepID=A0ACB7VPS6_DIOAL|nr:Bet v I type allergen protein [Dioscorea alata]
MSSTFEVETSIPASRMFKAAVLEWHNLGPKIVPEHIKSIDLIHGDGNAGSIRQINFTPALPFPFAKERLDSIDHNNFEVKNTTIEGADIGTKLECYSTHSKFTPTSSGGCIVKVTTTVKILPGVKPGDEEAKAKETITKAIKATEAYLLAHPTVCA